MGRCMQDVRLQVNTRVNNLIAGKQYLSAHGECCVKAVTGPQRSVHLRIMEPGMMSRKVQKGQVPAQSSCA